MKKRKNVKKIQEKNVFADDHNYSTSPALILFTLLLPHPSFFLFLSLFLHSFFFFHFLIHLIFFGTNWNVCEWGSRCEKRKKEEERKREKKKQRNLKYRITRQTIFFVCGQTNHHDFFFSSILHFFSLPSFVGGRKKLWKKRKEGKDRERKIEKEWK